MTVAYQGRSQPPFWQNQNAAWPAGRQKAAQHQSLLLSGSTSTTWAAVQCFHTVLGLWAKTCQSATVCRCALNPTGCSKQFGERPKIVAPLTQSLCTLPNIPWNFILLRGSEVSVCIKLLRCYMHFHRKRIDNMSRNYIRPRCIFPPQHKSGYRAGARPSILHAGAQGRRWCASWNYSVNLECGDKLRVQQEMNRRRAAVCE